MTTATAQRIVSIPKTADNFQALYLATGLVNKNHDTPFRSHVIVQDHCYYATDGRALMSVKQHEYDTIDPGFYQLITRTKQKIEMILVDVINSTVPDYNSVLNPTENHTTAYLPDCCIASSLFFHIVKETGLCFDYKYIQMLFDTCEYQAIKYLEKNTLLIETDIFTMAIMPINAEG